MSLTDKINGEPIFPPLEEPPEEKVLRFEVTIGRQVIVYAPDIETASAKALAVDGVAGRYKVVEVLEVGPSGAEVRPPIIDEPPKRPT
jgi:hypothetical protein